MIDNLRPAGKSTGEYTHDHDIFNLKTRNDLSQPSNLNKQAMLEQSLKNIESTMKV
jgi:hypothetical protein